MNVFMMNLLKLLIGSDKFVEPCFLCFKNDFNNLNIRTVFEIRNKHEIISLSLEDMIKNLFSTIDLLFMHACSDCSHLISKLYILLHNRKYKIVLLDCLVKQLLVETKDMCNIPVSDNKVTVKVQVPSYQDLIDKKRISRDDSDYVTSHNNKSKENIASDRDTQLKICQYCSEMFQGTYELSSHLKTHRKKRQRRRIYHYCNDCHYKTLSKTTLQAHINKNHLNTRPYICQVCYKGFYNRSNLNEHTKIHNSQRTQVCELCGSGFIHRKSLMEHLRLHSDTRPYKCDICKKSFITSGRRSDHIKRSHMEKTECCLICNKKYSLKKELTRHMNNVHLRSM